MLKTLEGRLTVAFAAGLFIVLCVFSAVSAVFLAQLSEAALDARLRETATAVAAIAVDARPDLTLDRAQSAQFARVVPTRLDAALVRRDGTVAETTATVIPQPVAALVYQAAENSSVRNVAFNGEELRVAYSPIDAGGQSIGGVAIWASTAPISDFKQLLVAVILIGIPLIIGLAIVSSGFIVRRGLAPLRDIAALAGEIEGHDLSRRLRPTNPDDELGRLSATFDRMLDRLEAAFGRQRRFTADASHELRAPLAVIQAEADLALRGEKSATEFRVAMESVASEADRLEALIGDLLALARAESAPASATSVVDLAADVEDSATRLDALASRRSVRIERDLEHPAFVHGDAEALARVPLAIIDNAVKYAPAGGRVEVSLRIVDGSVELCVRDDGPGFSAEGLERATDRFWRDDAVRGRSGTGLGLSIVRAIVESGGGALRVANQPTGGGEVTVRLPSAS